MFSRSRNPLLTFLLSYHVWVTSKIQVNFRFNRFSEVLMTVSYKFLKFLHYLCFRGQGIHYWHSHWATMFGWPWKSRSISGSIGFPRYWWLCLMDFNNFFTIYVFEVKESIADIPTELPCLSDFENSGQLPVQWVLRGTDDCVLWISTISLLFKFLRSGNPLLTFLLSYHVWVTSNIQVSFRYKRYWWLCLMDFQNFFTVHVFQVKESISDFPTKLSCVDDLENQGQLAVQEVQEVQMILSYGISQFLHCLCFRGQGIHFWHSYRVNIKQVQKSIR